MASAQRESLARRPIPWRRHALATLIFGAAVVLWFSPSVYAPAARPSAVRSAAPLTSLRAQASNSWSAQLQTVAPAGTARIQLLRDGRLIDDVPFNGPGPLVYDDYLLWPATTYQYVVRAIDRGNKPLREESTTLTTPPQLGSFPRLYSDNSLWNRPIPADAVVDPNSAAIVSRALARYARGSSLATADDWGRPLAYAGSLSAPYQVHCTMFDCATQVAFRIPRYARPNSGSDHHLVVLDATSNEELDMWLAAYNPKTDSWSSGGRYVTAADGWGAMCASSYQCHGAVAAGFAAFGGVVRPEEIAQGHIDHALFVTDPYTRKDYAACPATHTDGISADPAAIPEGARIQLDPAFNVNAQPWPRWEKVIAHALQTYGGYVGDTGGTLGLVGEARLDRGYDAWSLAGLPPIPALATFPWSQFRVLQLARC
jgi:hypothetical protein